MKKKTHRVKHKRFWWFHWLFKTETYKSCKLIEDLMRIQEYQARFREHILEHMKSQVLYGNKPDHFSHIVSLH